MPDTPSSSSSTSIPELPFRVQLSATGRGLVEVGGVDITSKVGALRFDAPPRGHNRLTLELVGGADLEGVAEVHVVRQSESIAAFLSAIDPDELEKVALARMDFGDGSVTKMMLDVLVEWAGDG